MDELNGSQRRYLRGLGNGLAATVFVGREGLTEAVIASLEEAFRNQELIKVRIERTCPIHRKEVAPELARAVSAQLVQILGQTVLLYRADAEEPTLMLPQPPE